MRAAQQHCCCTHDEGGGDAGIPRRRASHQSTQSILTRRSMAHGTHDEGGGDDGVHVIHRLEHALAHVGAAPGGAAGTGDYYRFRQMGDKQGRTRCGLVRSARPACVQALAAQNEARRLILPLHLSPPPRSRALHAAALSSSLSNPLAQQARRAPPPRPPLSSPADGARSALSRRHPLNHLHKTVGAAGIHTRRAHSSAQLTSCRRRAAPRPRGRRWRRQRARPPRTCPAYGAQGESRGFGLLTLTSYLSHYYPLPPTPTHPRPTRPACACTPRPALPPARPPLIQCTRALYCTALGAPCLSERH